MLCIVIGFGSVAISGAYGAIGRNAAGRRARAETVSELRRFFATDSKLEYLLAVGPLFGIAAMAVRPGGSEFSALWVVAGLVIWVVASGLLLGVVRPAERRIRAATSAVVDGPEGPDSSLPTACRRLMWASAATDLLFVVALFFMVTQPR